MLGEDPSATGIATIVVTGKASGVATGVAGAVTGELSLTGAAVGVTEGSIGSGLVVVVGCVFEAEAEVFLVVFGFALLHLRFAFFGCFFAFLAQVVFFEAAFASEVTKELCAVSAKATRIATRARRVLVWIVVRVILNS